MAVHNIQTWRLRLDQVSGWTASSFLLDSLAGYANAVGNGFEDREQCYNFLIAWRLATPPGKLRRVNGPVPITEGRVSVQNLRNVFSKLSAAAAADLIVEHFLSDPFCGFTDSVAIIATALEAWCEAPITTSASRSNKMIGTIIITLPASIPLGMWTAKQRIPVWLIPFMGFALGIVIGQLNP